MKLKLRYMSGKSFTFDSHAMMSASLAVEVAILVPICFWSGGFFFSLGGGGTGGGPGGPPVPVEGPALARLDPSDWSRSISPAAAICLSSAKVLCLIEALN